MDVTFQSGFRVTEKLRKSRGFPHAPAPTRAESPPAAPRLPWYVCRSRRAYADPASRTASRCTLGRSLVHAAGWDQCATACGPASCSQSASAALGACVLRPDPLPATNARNRRPVTATTLFQSVTSPESHSAQPFQTGVCHSAVPVCSLRGFAPRGSPFLFSAE